MTRNHYDAGRFLSSNRGTDMIRFVTAVSLFAFLGVALASAGADGPQVVELWPGKAPEEPGTIGAEYVRMSPTESRKKLEVTEPTRLVTNVTQADPHDLSAGQGEGHRHGGADLPRGRLLEPLLAAGRRGGRGLAELAGGDRHHPQVSRAAASRRGQGRAGSTAAAGCPAGGEPGPEQGQGMGHRSRIASASSASRRAAIWPSRRRPASRSEPTSRSTTSTKSIAGRISPSRSIRATSRPRTRMNSLPA